MIKPSKDYIVKPQAFPRNASAIDGLSTQSFGGFFVVRISKLLIKKTPAVGEKT